MTGQTLERRELVKFPCEPTQCAATPSQKQRARMHDSSRVHKAITEAAITSHDGLRTGADGGRFGLVVPH